MKKPKSRETIASTGLKSNSGSRCVIHDLIIIATHPESKKGNIGKLAMIEGPGGQSPHPDTLEIDKNLQSVVVFPPGSSLRLEDCQFDSPVLDCWIGWKVPVNAVPDSVEFSVVWSSEQDRQTLFSSAGHPALARPQGWFHLREKLDITGRTGIGTLVFASTPVSESRTSTTTPLFVITGTGVIEHKSNINTKSSLNRPNLILITLDTTRKDHISLFSDDHYGVALPYTVRTPALELLASEGVLMANATTPVSSTGPAHVSLMTGLYPLSTGVHKNGVPLHRDFRTLAETLLEQGYETGAFVSGYSVKGYISGLYQGFLTYDDLFTGQSRRWEQTADAAVSKALAWLQQQEGPYFLWLHLFDPHFRYSPPPFFNRFYDTQYSGPFEALITRHWGTPEAIYRNKIGMSPRDVAFGRSLYAGEVTYTDSCLGNFLFELKSRKDWDNTVVLVTADHGEYLGEHGHFFHHNGIREQLLRVPMILRIPGLRTIKRNEPVSLIDCYPTILDLLNIPRTLPDQGCEGLSFAQLVSTHTQNPKMSERFMKRHLFAEFLGQFSVRASNWKYSISTDPEKSTTFAPSIQAEFLYNLSKDPYESENLAEQDEFRTRKQDLSESLLTWLKTTSQRYGQPAEEAHIDIQVRQNLEALGYIH